MDQQNLQYNIRFTWEHYVSMQRKDMLPCKEKTKHHGLSFPQTLRNPKAKRSSSQCDWNEKRRKNLKT